MGKFRKAIVAGGISLAASSGLTGGAHAAGEIEWNGFGGVYGVKAVGDVLFDKATGDFTYTNYSRFGLNVRGNISDDVYAAGQFVVSGDRLPFGSTNPDYKLIANWAFGAWHKNGWELKAGRQLYPILLYSEYADVGALLPQVRPNILTYAVVPFNFYDGLSAAYTAKAGDAKITARVMGGNNNFATTQPTGVRADTNMNRVYAGDITAESGGVTLHGFFGHAFATTALSNAAGTTLLTAQGNLSLMSASARYQGHGALVVGEYVRYVSDDGTPVPGSSSTAYQSNTGAYGLVGYEVLPDLMPTYSLGWTNPDNGLAEGTVTSNTLGLRYGGWKGVVFKGEYTWANGFWTNRGFGGSTNVPFMKSQATGSSNVQEGAQTVFFGVDFLF